MNMLPPMSRRTWVVSLPIAFLCLAWLISTIWLFKIMSVAEWAALVVSGLGLLVALIVAVWNMSEQRRLTQMNFAVTLWGQWTEQAMVDARNAAWDALAEMPIERGAKRVGLLRKSSPEKYRAIARVDHFFADLNDFLEAEVLDKREVEALFRDTLQAYFCFLLVVDVSDGLDEQAGAEQQMWFETKVLGLAKRLRLERPEQYQRYGKTFEANLREAAATSSG